MYITRPESGEILMGGSRHLEGWFTEPHYSHHSVLRDLRPDVEEYIDAGWKAHLVYRQRVDRFLKQDMELFNKIWDEVFLSVLPKGMTLEEGLQWEKTPKSDGEEFDGYAITNWHLLLDDRQWEGKCNTCYKRFLLRVDLRAGTVERIDPLVFPRATPECMSPAGLRTSECSFEHAIEFIHETDTEDGIPF